MKTSILTCAMISIMVTAGFTAFGQEARNPTGKYLMEAYKELQDARLDSIAAFQKFRTEAWIKIKKNESRIFELKEKSWNENMGVEQRYNQMVIVLQQKNNILQKKIRESDGTKTSNWLSFKREFNSEMAELENGIKNIVADTAN